MKKVNSTILAAFALLLLSAGTAKAQTARMQVIHNSPDYIIDTVDVWANNTLIADNVVFRKATQMIAIDSGDYVITIAKKFSADTTAATSLLKVNAFRIDSGKIYLAVISGVVDTTQYATNPGGLDRSLAFKTINTYNNIATTNRVALYFANGVPDAAPFDLNKIIAAPTKLGNDIAYGNISDSTVFTLANHMLNLTSADSTMFEGAFKLTTTGLSTKVGVIFTSGVYTQTGNPTPAKAMKVFVAYSDGSVVELVKQTAQIQIVHNSADTLNRMVDVYMNGVKTHTGFGFRTATAFTTLNAMVPYTVAVAPNGSANAGAAFYTTTLTFDSSANYYAVACGVRTPNPANFKSNPNGVSIGFKIATYKGAKKTSLFTKNVDLLYFHGVTDLQATTIRGVGQIQFLSKNDTYQGFHGYASHSAVDDIQLEVSDAATEKILTNAFADLMAYQGKAGLVFASGFKQIVKDSGTTIPAQQLDSAKLFIAWPDGKVDTMYSKWSVGITEQLINSHSLSVYPNPASNNVQISFESKGSNTVAVELMDVTGKKVFAEAINAQAGLNTLNVDISAFNQGLYIMNLKSNQQVLSSKVSIIK